MVGRGGEGDVARSEAAARREHRFALGEVESARAHVFAGGDAGRKHDLGALAARLFLHDDGVGAVRHRRAGENPHRLARRDAAVEGASRRQLADHREPGRRRRGIGGAHGVAVHRRIGEGRLGA